MRPAQIDQKDIDREVAHDEYSKYCCPDVEIIREWPREKQCDCGFRGVPNRTDGKVGYYLSCPDCKGIMSLKEIE